MQQVQGSNPFQNELCQVAETMRAEDERLSAPFPLAKPEVALQEKDFAKYLLALKRHYHVNNPRHYGCVKKLQLQHPEWIVIEFLKATPPTHLKLTQLRALFSLVVRVYSAANRQIDLDPKTKDDQSEELACKLYEILRQIDLMEAKERATTTALTTAGGGTAAAFAAGSLLNPWLAPAFFFFGSGISYLFRKVISGEPLLVERERPEELVHIKLNNYVQYAFKTKSSGAWRRYFKHLPSYTIGELHIDLQGEPFTCDFNFFPKHKINPLDVQKLHLAMLRRIKANALGHQASLSIIGALTKMAIPRGAEHPPEPAFIDPELALCLDDLQLRAEDLSKSVIVLPAMPPPIARPKATILDVPTHNYSCGLYALALGAIRAHKERPKVETRVPAYILEWDESWLRSTNRDLHMLEQISGQLRKEISDALSVDSEFIIRRRAGFAFACLHVIGSLPYPVEFEALVKSNEAFLTKLKAEITPELYQMPAKELDFYAGRFKDDSTQLEESGLYAMMRLIRTGRVATFAEVIETFCTETKDPLARVIKQWKLHSQTWGLFERLEQRQSWQNAARAWLEAKLADFISGVTDPAQKSSLFKVFGLLLSVKFEGDGNSFTMAQPDFIESQILMLMIGNKIGAEWSKLYVKYLVYLQFEKNYMLTVDELSILASRWGLDLEVYEWANQDDSRAPPANRLRARLTNPSYVHWQVYSY